MKLRLDQKRLRKVLNTENMQYYYIPDETLKQALKTAYGKSLQIEEGYYKHNGKDNYVNISFKLEVKEVDQNNQATISDTQSTPEVKRKPKAPKEKLASIDAPEYNHNTSDYQEVEISEPLQSNYVNETIE
jgi:hypothetical protein